MKPYKLKAILVSKLELLVTPGILLFCLKLWKESWLHPCHYYRMQTINFCHSIASLNKAQVDSPNIKIFVIVQTLS